MTDRDVAKNGNDSQHGADLDTLFSPTGREELNAARVIHDSALSLTAKEILPKLKTLVQFVDSSGYTELKPGACMFYSSVKQVAEGQATLINFGVAREIGAFQEEVTSALRRWSSCPCYHDVIVHRERLGSITKTYFPVLNQIFELIDYGGAAE